MDAWSATLRGDEARLRELLRLDLHHVDDVHPVSGQSILHLACAQRKESIVGFILRKGADPDLKDGLLGETALHKAAARGLARAVQMLVAVGADRDALNRRGQRPIDLARKIGDALSVRVLGDSEARRARMRGKFRVADLLETDQDAPELDEDLEKIRELEKRYFLARRSGDEYRAALESVEDDLREQDDTILNLQNEIRELRGVVARETKRADDAVATAQRLRAASDGTSKLQSESKRLQRAIETERKRREEDKRLWARERERLETKFRDQYNLNFDLQREVIETSRSRQQTYRERS